MTMAPNPMRRSMKRALGGNTTRVYERKMMRSASRIKPRCVHIRAFMAGSSSSPALRLLLHILDTGERNALGAFLGIAQIEFVPGQEHRIAVDVVGDAGTVG